MNLKPLIVVIILHVAFAFNSTESPKEIGAKWETRSQQEHPECLKKTGATEEEVDQYYQLIRIPTRYNFKCYIDCVYRVYGFINEDGSVNKDTLVKNVEKLTDEILDFCDVKYQEKLDRCEKAYEYAYCITHYHSIYFQE
ncbi:hypothetical protein RI129_011034 [Pyrocoelia pectoralis]|uniref:Uncharacterized protein n=1 Tax=Pyrocoelia pectoralis TaxID=417401 RepID=A0AAN7ZIG1_9COLE